MVEVRPWLFVGKYSDTLTRDALDRSRIQAVLQLAAPVEYQGIQSLYLPVDDGAPVQPNALAHGIAFVRAEYSQGHRVLIACGAGVSRAVTFATAALKEEESLSLVDALRAIVKVQPEAMPHPELWQSLCAYYGEDVPFLAMWRQIRTELSED